MKLLCFFLSMFVLFLSTVPFCWDESCSDHDEIVSCETQCEQHSKKNPEKNSKIPQEEHCTNCSPFMTCSTFSGFSFSKLVFDFEKTHFNTNTSIVFYTPQFTDDFCAAIWQPPKVS